MREIKIFDRLDYFFVKIKLFCHNFWISLCLCLLLCWDNSNFIYCQLPIPVITTCSSEYSLNLDSVVPTLEECENKCTQNESCKFIFYGDDNSCVLYSEACSSIDVSIDVSSIGKTYKKDNF